MAKAYKSEALAAVHGGMAELHKIGMLDGKTMRGFDRSCLTPVLNLSPAAIRRIRAKAAVSQAVFRHPDIFIHMKDFDRTPI